MLQERIRAGKELTEAKRIAEENERKRSVLNPIFFLDLGILLVESFNSLRFLFSFGVKNHFPSSVFQPFRKQRERKSREQERESDGN